MVRPVKGARQGRDIPPTPGLPPAFRQQVSFSPLPCIPTVGLNRPTPCIQTVGPLQAYPLYSGRRSNQAHPLPSDSRPASGLPLHSESRPNHAQPLHSGNKSNHQPRINAVGPYQGQWSSIFLRTVGPTLNSVGLPEKGPTPAFMQQVPTQA